MAEPRIVELPSGTHRLPNSPIVVTLDWESEPDVTERQIWGGENFSVCGDIIRRPKQ